MKKVDIDVLKDAANRLLFTMSEEEFNMLLNDFDVIQKQFSLVENIKGIDDVEPMTFPYDIFINQMRDDIPINNLSKEDILKNAIDTKDGYIKLPKVIK